MTTIKTMETIKKETINNAITLLNDLIATDEISTKLYECLNALLDNADDLEMYLDTVIALKEDYDNAIPFISVTFEYLADYFDTLMNLLDKYTIIKIEECNNGIMFVVD